MSRVFRVFLNACLHYILKGENVNLKNLYRILEYAKYAALQLLTNVSAQKTRGKKQTLLTSYFLILNYSSSISVKSISGP